MKHSVVKKERSAVGVTITLTKEEVTLAKKGIVEAVAAKVEIPGFRKGHAPLDKVEAAHKDAIANELIDYTLKNNFEAVITAEKLKPISHVYNVTTKSVDGGFEVGFDIDEYPEVTLGEYKGLSVEKKTAEYKEEFLTQEIDSLLARKINTVDAPAGHKAVMGDIVDLAFDGSIDGVPFDGGKADSHELKLGSKTFIDNFEEQLVGYTVGQEGDVKVNFPAEYGHAPLAGKPAVFKVKINAIKQEVKPELTDDLAKELGFENVADLKAKKKEEIMKREEQIVKNDTIGKLLAKISEGTKVELPMSMVQGEIQAKLREMEQHLSMQGANIEMYLKMIGKTQEEMMKEMLPMAASKVKTDLVLEAIAKKENITVTPEELTEKMTEIGKMYGMDLAKLEEELNKNNNFENFKANLNVDIMMEKAIDLVVASSK